MRTTPQGLQRRKAAAFVIGAMAFCLAIVPADAIIDSNLQMQLGNPTGATTDPNNHTNYLILRGVNAIGYSDTRGQPIWVSWDLTSSDVGSSGRTDAWAVDTNLPPSFKRIPTSTYGSVNGQGYDRGHMTPSADRTASVQDNEQVFIMSNIIPQASQQNQGVWANLENYSRTLLSSQELLITSAPYDFGSDTVDGGLVGIASNTFKIIVCVPLGGGNALGRITNADPSSIRIIAVDIPNTGAVGSSPWSSFLTSTKQIQSKTGYNFFSALPNNLAWVLRSKVDGQANPSPVISSFSPASAPVSTIVVITGTNLDATTNVTFNGASATFTINSVTNITATVPVTASSGPIRVSGLGGAAVSPGSFVVTGSTFVDLAVSASHSGNFTQGDTGGFYTITVTNIGTVASSGAVTASDTLPVGLTATAIGGAGWTTDLSTMTATRSDVLPPGAAYPSITITVNVSSNSATMVTNTATVAGGGDINLANNTAYDQTTINSLPITDLAVGVAHSGKFAQGDIGDVYTITVTNAGTLSSSGTVTIGDTLPAGLSATAIAGTGWTADLISLTATRSDILTPGSGYPPLTITVNIASNAPTTVTNTATLSGGSDANLANNIASHPAAVSLGGSGGSNGTLVGWDTSGTSNFGPSPFSSTTNAADLTSVGLGRGFGVTTNSSAATRGWGGNGFTSTSAAAAVTAGQLVTFTVSASPGYTLSCSSFARFDYRRSSTGPTSGLLQYQIGSGTFSDIATVAYTSTSSSGASLPAIDLSGIAALQNVGPGTNLTFRIVNWGATSSGGTWYIYDAAVSSAADFLLEGAVTPVDAQNPPLLPFPITTSGFIGPGQFVITWSSIAGRSYQVQSVASLPAVNWTTNATVAATGALTSWTNPVASEAVQFYRVHGMP